MDNIQKRRLLWYTIGDSTVPVNPYTDPTKHDPMFGKLWQLFHDVDPAIEWQSGGVEEKDHKVWVVWKGQTKAIGFVHELAKLTTDQLRRLLAIYWEG